MDDCPIFRIYTGAEAVADEMRRLVAEIPQAFAQHDLTLFERSHSKAAAQTYVTQETYSFKVTGPISRQRVPRQLIFSFDLWRFAGTETWPHAKNALLTVAYEPKYDWGWEPDQLLITSDGRLSDSSVFEACAVHADGRLLEWKGEGSTWYERCWLFSIPLMRINGPDAFQREIVDPVVTMLMKSAGPAKALEGTHAIRFRS